MIERHILIDLVARGLTDREIGEMFGVARHTVMRWRRKYDIATAFEAKPTDHGREHKYRMGCRCALCVDAHNARMRDYRRKRKAESFDAATRRYQPWTKKEERALVEALDLRVFCHMYGRSYDAAQNKRRRLLKEGDATS